MQTDKVQPKAETKQTNTESGSLETENVNKASKHRIRWSGDRKRKQNKHRIRCSGDRKRKQNKQAQNPVFWRLKT